MKEKIALSIRNEQDFGQNNKYLIEYSTTATFYKKNQQYYIHYFDENYQGASTFIKIEAAGERLSIYRYKPELQEFFQAGKTTTGKMATPYGNLKLKIDTQSLEIDLAGKNIAIKYSFYLEGKFISKNYLRISWEIP